jgi:hypothetical protein
MPLLSVERKMTVFELYGIAQAGEKEIIGTALKILLGIPVVAVCIFFWWLTGKILHFIIIKTRPIPSAYKTATEGFWWHLALGFVACAGVIIAYHVIVFRQMPASLDDLKKSVMPSTLILATVTFIALMWKAFR